MIGQNLKYKIMWKDKKVGQIDASKIIKDNITHYKISANAKINVVFSYHIDFLTQCAYSGKKMTSSYSNYKLNNKLKNETTINYYNSAYTCDNCEDFDSTITSIGFSISKLYFVEPLSPGAVFSERFGEYVLLKKESDHTYKMNLPNGHHNTYYYKKGKLVKISIDRGFYSMDFVRED